jgi:zinc protease
MEQASAEQPRRKPAATSAAVSLSDQDPAGKVFPYTVAQRTLPNGLKVLVIPLESPGIVTYWSIVRTGSRDEVEPGRSGFAHFFEHMMFRGTKKYPGEVYDRIVTAMGADSNAYTTDDYTAYHMTLAKEDLEQAFEIESDRFQNLSYSQQAFQTEAGAVFGEYRKSITSPFALLDEKLRDIAYDVHTYKHTTIGFEADIKAMPQAYDYSLDFFRRFYRPDNVVLLVAGDIQPDFVFALVDKYYRNWKPGYEPPKVVPEPPQQAARQGEVSYPGQTLPILQMSYKGDAFDPANADYVAAVLLGDLAFGETSEIYQKLVLKEQTVQMLGAYTPMNRDQPLFDILAMVRDVKNIESVRAEIEQTLQRYQTEPPPVARLQELKRHYRYAFLMGLDTPNAVAEELARPIALTGGVECVDRFYQAVERVTPGDVVRAARKYFLPERRTSIVLKGANS